MESTHEIRLSIMPVLLGDGLRLFDNSGIERRWHLKNESLTRRVLLSCCIGANQPAPSPERGEVRREGTSCRRTVASSGYQIMAVGRCW